jgi:hypothetical protein
MLTARSCYGSRELRTNTGDFSTNTAGSVLQLDRLLRNPVGNDHSP